MDKLNSFQTNEGDLAVTYTESMEVKAGVKCDVYSFDNDESKDLAVVSVEPNTTTPLQLILEGEDTIEGYISGSGELSVIKKSGEIQTHEFNQDKPGTITLGVGDTMQWEALEDGLVFYEICYPPYRDGRFKDLS